MYLSVITSHSNANSVHIDFSFSAFQTEQYVPKRRWCKSKDQNSKNCLSNFCCVCLICKFLSYHILSHNWWKFSLETLSKFFKINTDFYCPYILLLNFFNWSIRINIHLKLKKNQRKTNEWQHNQFNNVRTFSFNFHWWHMEQFVLKIWINIFSILFFRKSIPHNCSLKKTPTYVLC